MRLTDEQRLQVEYDKGLQTGRIDVANVARICKCSTDCYQQDGSLAYQKGDILITKTYWQQLCDRWNIES